MKDKGLVNKKKFGAKAVGWWAKVAPNLDPEIEEKIEKRKDSEEWEKL